MKIRLAMFSTALAMGIAAPVFAQSSVEIYGIIDEGPEYSSNAGGHPLYSITTAAQGGSRLGFRGTEDLGGGLKALFRLENGYDLGTGKLGQGGLMFGRQAYVGLEASHYGTVTLGRQYDDIVDFIGPLTVGDQWGGTIGSHPGDLDNFDNSFRTNNSVKYASPNYGGISFGGMYSFGGIAGDTSANRVWSMGAGYTGGPLQLGLGYLNVRNSNVSFFGNSGVTATTNNIASPVYSGYASATTYEVFGAGVNYTFGPALVGLLYSNIRFLSLNNTAQSGPNPNHLDGDAAFNDVEVSFRYHLTSALLLGLEYNYTRGNSMNGQDPAQYHQGTLGLDYFLSKRTDLYVVVAYQKASGVDSTGKAAVASINTVTPSSSDRQTIVSLGYRHKF
ncbi:gram-negative porin family protein [Paraburkholderia xenovorans LB400]|uniref:Outer membrane porin, OmpC family n=1 Tax=Paraburkholderia xenovorans (strain LB400) TaxID=266265 RepID=Q13H74_PARXL|nr:porin [Paraburkholderia xenovorans]ABE36565.1 outer membrane porin, OmpC family [Paraburkholderia xenovorans LB400]AIP34405.1 gram-negative porin family protein [Paraburkholderia xenovorans LB400]